MNKSLERREQLIDLKKKLKGDFYSLPIEVRYTQLLSEIVADEEQLYRSVKKFVKKYIDVHGDFFIKLDFDNSIEQICEQYGQDLTNEDYRDAIFHNDFLPSGETFPNVISDKIFKTFSVWTGDDWEESHLYYDLTLKEFGLIPNYLSENYFQNRIFFREIFTTVFSSQTIITLLKFFKKRATLKQLIETVQSDIVTEVKENLVEEFVGFVEYEDEKGNSKYYLSDIPFGLYTKEEYFEWFIKVDFDWEILNYETFKDYPGIIYIQEFLDYKSEKFNWNFANKILCNEDQSVFNLFLPKKSNKKVRLDFIVELLRHWNKDGLKEFEPHIWHSRITSLCEEEFDISYGELFDELQKFNPSKFENFINKLLGEDKIVCSRKKTLQSVKYLFEDGINYHYLLKRFKSRDNVKVEELILPVQLYSSLVTTSLTKFLFNLNSNLKIKLLFYNLKDQRDKKEFYHSVIDTVHDVVTECSQLTQESSQLVLQIPKLEDSEIDINELNQLVQTISELVSVEQVPTETVTGKNQTNLNKLHNQILSHESNIYNSSSETKRMVDDLL